MDETREHRRAERAEQDREREHAASHNAERARRSSSTCRRLKVDADVLKVLTVIDVAGDLDGVAAQGARYVFPGWPTETTQKNGKVEVEYLDKTAAAAKAREFLAGAESLAEIAGRLFCLIAAARYADERVVARSNRSMSSLTVRSGLPYSAQAIDLVDEICAQRLPDNLTEAVRLQRAEQARGGGRARQDCPGGASASRRPSRTLATCRLPSASRRSRTSRSSTAATASKATGCASSSSPTKRPQPTRTTRPPTRPDPLTEVAGGPRGRRSPTSTPEVARWPSPHVGD